MKNKFLFPLAFLVLAAIVSAFTYQANQLPKLPNYNTKMLKPSVSCSSRAWFNNCSANCNENQNCSCDGGVFYCTCSCSGGGGGGKGPKQITHNLPSVSEQQYKNWIKFSDFLLKELGTENAKAVHTTLVEMANSLISDNEDSYNKQAMMVNELFKKMSKFEKEQINNFFAKEQANIKI